MKSGIDWKGYDPGSGDYTGVLWVEPETLAEAPFKEAYLKELVKYYEKIQMQILERIRNSPKQETKPLNWDDAFKPDFIMKPSPVSKEDHKSWWMQRGLCPVCKSVFQKPEIQPGQYFECKQCSWNNMLPKKD